MSSINLEQDFLAALETAGLAPSSHNTQPWEVALVKSDSHSERIEQFLTQQDPTIKLQKPAAYMMLALNHTRHLWSLPAHRLEMVMSCGMFLESLFTILAGHKWRGEICWHGQGHRQALEPYLDLPSTWEPLAVISLYHNDDAPALNIPGTRSFSDRITNRGPYLDRKVPSEIIEDLLASNSLMFPEIRKQTQITLIQDLEMIKSMASFLGRHAELEFSNKAVWQETYKWIHFGIQECRRNQTGLPIMQLFGKLPPGVRYLLKLLLAPPSIQILSKLGALSGIGNQMEKAIVGSPALGYLNFKSEQVSQPLQLAGGALILDLWRRATEAGLVFHPLSIILQYPDLESTFRQKYNLPAGKGFFFFRMGYPKTTFAPVPKRNLASDLKIY